MNLRFLQVDAPPRKTPKTKLRKRKLVLPAIALFLIVVIALAGVGAVKDRIHLGKNTEQTQGQGQSEGSGNSENSGKTNVADREATAEFSGRLGSDFIRTLESGEYAIRYRTTAIYQGQPYEVEITYAVSGGSAALISDDLATIVKDDTVYMMNHRDKSLISWAVNNEGGCLKKIDTAGMAYLGNSEEDGLTCEEYSTATDHLKLYFKDKQLVKMAARINGEDTLMEILEVDKKAPDSMFEVPSGYRTTSI